MIKQDYFVDYIVYAVCERSCSKLKLCLPYWVFSKWNLRRLVHGFTSKRPVRAICFCLFFFSPIQFSPNIWLLLGKMFTFVSAGCKEEKSAAMSFPLKLADLPSLGSIKSATSRRFPKEQHKTVLMVNFTILTWKVLTSSCGKDRVSHCFSKLYREVFAKWHYIKKNYTYLKVQKCQGG